MPNILAAAADPHSWLDLFRLPKNSVTNAASLTTGTNLYELFCKDPNFASIALSSNELFIKFNISTMGYYLINDTTTTYAMRGDPRLLFTIKNANGKIIASMGFQIKGTADTPAINGKLALFIWNELDGTTNTKLVSPTTTVVSSSDVYTVLNAGFLTCDHTISLHLKIDQATPANSVMRMVINGINAAEIVGSAVNASTNLVMTILTIKEFITSNGAQVGTSYYLQGSMTYMVIADFADYSLTAYPLKPSAFGTVNDFTGVIGNITSWAQDQLYLSTSAETAVSVDIKLTAASITGNAKLYKNDTANTIAALFNYGMFRYIQSGGVSATFSITLYVGTTQASDATNVVITANLDDTKYQTAQISKVITNLISSGNFTLADLNNLYARITLVGV